MGADLPAVKQILPPTSCPQDCDSMLAWMTHLTSWTQPLRWGHGIRESALLPPCVANQSHCLYINALEMFDYEWPKQLRDVFNVRSKLADAKLLQGA